MSRNLRIVVISHVADTFLKGGYLLGEILKVWEQRGAEIISMNDPGAEPPPADLAISHIDMTVVGQDYARLFDHYPVVVNGRVLDISKTRISDQIVRREDHYQGPVVVKTERNFGGMREARARWLAGEEVSPPDVRRPWRRMEVLNDYPIFESAAAVPSGVWGNPNLVVDKFLPELHQDGTYHLRQWEFLGDRGILNEIWSREPIVKGRNTIGRKSQEITQLPPELWKKREELGFDYGKFDYGMVDGQVVIYDVNRTPSTPRTQTDSTYVTTMVRTMAEGLDYFVRQLDSPG